MTTKKILENVMARGNEYALVIPSEEVTKLDHCSKPLGLSGGGGRDNPAEPASFTIEKKRKAQFQSTEERLQKRLSANRRSAAASRQRRLDLIKGLQQSVVSLSERIQGLETENRELRRRLGMTPMPPGYQSRESALVGATSTFVGHPSETIVPLDLTQKSCVLDAPTPLSRAFASADSVLSSYVTIINNNSHNMAGALVPQRAMLMMDDIHGMQQNMNLAQLPTAYLGQRYHQLLSSAERKSDSHLE